MNIKNYLSLYILLILLTCCQSSPKTSKLDSPVLLSDKFSFTEGPSADSKGNVYFTDQPNDKIYIWEWKTNNIKLFLDKTGRANGTFIDKEDHLLTCSDEKGGIWRISPDKSIQVLTQNFEGKRLNGPNDLWQDEWGGVYFTDPLYERDYWENFKIEIPERNLYYRNKEGKISKLESFIQPNGIIGSTKLNKLYVSDIDAGKTYEYEILGEGRLASKKLFCEMGSDGMTLDKEGNLYLTGKGVTVFNKKGEKIKHINIPENWTSNVTFGGKNNDILFITASKSVYILQTKTREIQ